VEEERDAWRGDLYPGFVGTPIGQRNKGMTRLDFSSFGECEKQTKVQCVSCVLDRPQQRCRCRCRAKSRSLLRRESAEERRRVGSCFLFRQVQSTWHVTLIVSQLRGPSVTLPPGTIPRPLVQRLRATMASTLLVDRHVSYIQSLGDVRSPPTNPDFSHF
jgi:hypothetical protein